MVVYCCSEIELETAAQAKVVVVVHSLISGTKYKSIRGGVSTTRRLLYSDALLKAVVKEAGE